MTYIQDMSKSKIIHLDNLSLQDAFNEDSELIPLLTPEDEEIINKEKVPETLPILPLRNTVLFPGVVIPITVGRDKSIKLIKDAYTGDKIIIPNQFANNHEFPALSGFFTLKAIAKNDTLLTYHVSITNRKFTKKENIILNGKTYEAYTHTYNFVQKTFLDGNRPLSETAETVEETYLVGYGIVCQERQGTMIPINVQDVQGMEQKLISELLNIQ